MKLILKISLVFLLLIPNCSFGEVDQEPIISSTKYYASFTGIVSSYLDYAPRGEISIKTAANIAHYKVGYDKNGRILEISFFKGKIPSNDSYYRTHMVKCRYAKNKEIRTYFDKTGSKSNMWRHYYEGGNVHQEEFVLDDKGNKIELTFKDSLYSAVGNGTGTFLYKWKKIDYRSVIQEHYDKDGNATVYRNFFPFKIVRITTDENGYSKYVSNIDSNNKIIFSKERGFATLEVFFDDYGNENGWGYLDEKGNLVNLNTPEEFGTALWMFTEKYRDIKLGTVESRSEKYYDKNKKRLANNGGVYEVRYTLDEYANLKTISYYNLDGQKQNDTTSRFHRAELIYNDLKERVKVLKYDTENKLIED